MLGDVSHKRSVGQTPRGPQDMYNVRPSVPSEKVGSTKDSVVKLEPFGCYLLFCINHSEFCVLSDDPTLNVLKDMILLTVTVHKNLKLAQKKKTWKPPVFTGPMLLHQNSDWKMFPKFAHCLITEQPLAGIQSYGSDGEKALTDGFERNFQFAFGMRCFIHFKKIIERELSERKFNGSSKSDFMLEIRWVTHFIAGAAERNKNAGCI